MDRRRPRWVRHPAVNAFRRRTNDIAFDPPAGKLAVDHGNVDPTIASTQAELVANQRVWFSCVLTS